MAEKKLDSARLPSVRSASARMISSCRGRFRFCSPRRAVLTSGAWTRQVQRRGGWGQGNGSDKDENLDTRGGPQPPRRRQQVRARTWRALRDAAADGLPRDDLRAPHPPARSVRCSQWIGPRESSTGGDALRGIGSRARLDGSSGASETGKGLDRAPTPSLIVEIISDSTRRRDYNQKKSLYQMQTSSTGSSTQSVAR